MHLQKWVTWTLKALIFVDIVYHCLTFFIIQTNEMSYHSHWHHPIVCKRSLTWDAHQQPIPFQSHSKSAAPEVHMLHPQRPHGADRLEGVGLGTSWLSPAKPCIECRALQGLLYCQSFVGDWRSYGAMMKMVIFSGWFHYWKWFSHSSKSFGNGRLAVVFRYVSVNCQCCW